VSLYEADKAEKRKLMEEWLAANQLDLDEYQRLVDEQMEKRREIEEKMNKKLRPVLKKIAIFQKFVDGFTNKKNRILEEIKKLDD
jgi:polyhydroxyalkanoate synthesis regulator phasin